MGVSNDILIGRSYKNTNERIKNLKVDWIVLVLLLLSVLLDENDLWEFPVIVGETTSVMQQQ